MISKSIFQYVGSFAIRSTQSSHLNHTLYV